MWAGCQPAEPKTPSALEVLREDPKTVVERVAWLRQLPERRPTELVFHEPEVFARVVQRRSTAGGAPATSADAPAFQHAFGFSGMGRQASASLARVQQSEVVAFFDDRTFSVHVRSDATGDVDGISPTWVVAHEIGHSLQHQYFPIPDVASMSNEDERLAALAMLEGDAMLVMLAYAAYELHAPLTRTLARFHGGVLKEEDSPYAGMTHSSQALRRAPPAVRDRLVFPYLAGGFFMGSLYRTGGYALVNRVYSRPPTTTEQVLHPEKYLAGELPVSVQEPALPRGFRLVARGRLGELQTRSLLRQCNDAALAKQAAAGWGGDAFAIGEREGAGVLLWSTTWDQELDAREFEHALLTTAACWQRSLGPRAGATFTLRKGSHVAVVRGLAAASAQEALQSLTKLVAPRQLTTPPFGSIALRPIVAPPPRVPPYRLGEQVLAPYLGLSVPIPPGFRANLRDEIELDADTGKLLVLVSDWVVGARTNELLFLRFRESFAQALDVDRAALDMVAEGSAPTPLGPGFQRTWRVNRTSVMARLVIIPACRSTGALLVASVWSDSATQRSLDWVLANLRQTSTNVPPLCAELNP